MSPVGRPGRRVGCPLVDPETKKTRAVPGRTGDRSRDDGEAGISRLAPDIALCNDGDGVPLALVFAQEHGAGFEAPRAIGSWPVAPRESIEMLCGLGIQPAEGLLLNMPAEEPRQDVLAEGRRGDDRNVERHRVRSESTPSDRTRSISASIPSRSNEGRGMAVTRPCAPAGLCASAGYHSR